MSTTVFLHRGDDGAVFGRLLRFNGHTGAFEGFVLGGLGSETLVKHARIESSGKLVYSGPIRITSVINVGSGLVCEFALEGEQPPQILDANRQEERLADSLTSWRAATTILPQYRLLVHDMAQFLGLLSEWQQGDTSTPTGSDDRPFARRRQAELLGAETASALDSLWERFEPIALQISEQESDRYQSYLRQHLLRYLLISPFACRAFTKPLGYAGDYGCVNMIEGDPYQGDSVFAMLVNNWLLQQLPSKAHRSRIDYLEIKLAQELARVSARGQRLRVFDLGCGPAIEIQRFLRSNPASSESDFTLLDFNGETIQYVSMVLDTLCQRHGRHTTFRYIANNVREFLRSAARNQRPEGEGYHLIYCAGLFDYLPDSVCSQLLGHLYRMLHSGGLLLATNVKASRAIELSLRYMLDWRLIFRSQRDFMKLVPSEVPESGVNIVGVDQGYNLFLEIRKPEEGFHG